MAMDGLKGEKFFKKKRWKNQNQQSKSHQCVRFKTFKFNLSLRSSSASSLIALEAAVHSGSKRLKPARNKLIWISLMCFHEFLVTFSFFTTFPFSVIHKKNACAKNRQK